MLKVKELESTHSVLWSLRDDSVRAQIQAQALVKQMGVIVYQTLTLKFLPPLLSGVSLVALAGLGLLTM